MDFPPFSGRPLVPQVRCLAHPGHLQQFFGAGGPPLRVFAQTGQDELVYFPRDVQLGAMRWRYWLLLRMLH